MYVRNYSACGYDDDDVEFPVHHKHKIQRMARFFKTGKAFLKDPLCYVQARQDHMHRISRTYGGFSVCTMNPDLIPKYDVRALGIDPYDTSHVLILKYISFAVMLAELIRG